ncbi:MAG TPA: DUF3300 domain-containing protein [Burkholderiales bacterium]|nr:DUF3300 domain-containing protein [Burkholderiales bacterium]
MKWLLGLLAAIAIGAPAFAQKVYSQAELDALLAPVALQTDGVLSQVLMAATYPEDVAAAAAFSRANPHLRGDDAVRAAEQEPWDPSVKSLLAFPELLARMDESPQWLRDLGEAFLGQQAQVMDTVQGLRRRAQANGQLVSSDETAVYQQGEAIVVQPRAQVVYVRYYDPYIVYGPWWWGPHYRPVFWRPWSPFHVTVSHGFFYSAPDWHHRHVRVIHRPVHVHRHQHQVVPGRWQHRPPVHRAQGVTVRPHVRVPEAQRRPIVQQRQPMPAASGTSQQHRGTVRHSEPGREHRSVEPRREQRSDGHHNQRGREARGGGERRGGAEQRGGGQHRGGQRGHRG